MKNFAFFLILIVAGCSFLKSDFRLKNSNIFNSDKYREDVIENNIIAILNDERINSNLEPIIEDSLLTSVAMKYADEFIRNDSIQIKTKQKELTSRFFLENGICDNIIYPFTFRSGNIEGLILKIKSNNELRNSLINSNVNYFGISLLKKEEYFLTLYLVERYIFFEPFTISIEIESSLEARTFISEFVISGRTKLQKLYFKLFKNSIADDIYEDKELLMIQDINIDNGYFNAKINLQKYRYSNQSFLINIYSNDDQNVANIICGK